MGTGGAVCLVLESQSEAEKEEFLPMPAFLVGDRRPTVIMLPSLTLKVVDSGMP